MILGPKIMLVSEEELSAIVLVVFRESVWSGVRLLVDFGSFNRPELQSLQLCCFREPNNEEIPIRLASKFAQQNP
ncbi:hypothetical protein V6N12_051967 [Hibiscus sabdariffa]|uniref:Uncharacterized protein n=1 Tax=Hibiscus sabdariffa TaxID=183260 RepID=A0ABR2GHG0_9ROSI